MLFGCCLLNRISLSFKRNTRLIPASIIFSQQAAQHHHEGIEENYDALRELVKNSDYLRSKINEISQREKEIQLKERKILEIENRIENSMGRKEKFFSKEFIQGFLIGLLVFLIGLLVYIKLSGKFL